MSHRTQALSAFAKLLSYPTETYVEAAEVLYVILQDALPEAAESMSRFGAFVEPLELTALEELYASTFDVNPACALEVGWHLFGEEYARGLFLVRLRNEMRERGLEESTELPDHLAHVLAIIAAMNQDEAERFVQACVHPAVDKMQQALERVENPFRDVIRCLSLVLEDEFGRAADSDDDLSEPVVRSAAPHGDPLRDFPMPCVSCEPDETVELQMDLPRTPEMEAQRADKTDSIAEADDVLPVKSGNETPQKD